MDRSSTSNDSFKKENVKNRCYCFEKKINPNLFSLHLIRRYETIGGDPLGGDFSVQAPSRRDERSVRGQGEMDSWIWYEISLQFLEANVHSALEPHRSRDAGGNLSQQAVQIGESWIVYVQIAVWKIWRWIRRYDISFFFPSNF